MSWWYILGPDAPSVTLVQLICNDGSHRITDDWFDQSSPHTALSCGVRWCWNWFLIWTRLELECCLMNFSSHFHIYKNTNTSDLGQVLKSSGHHTSVSSCKTSLLLMLDELGFVLVLLMIVVQDLKYLDLFLSSILRRYNSLVVGKTTKVWAICNSTLIKQDHSILILFQSTNGIISQYYEIKLFCS